MLITKSHGLSRPHWPYDKCTFGIFLWARNWTGKGVYSIDNWSYAEIIDLLDWVSDLGRFFWIVASLVNSFPFHLEAQACLALDHIRALAVWATKKKCKIDVLVRYSHLS
jgi:hypothetical protein